MKKFWFLSLMLVIGITAAFTITQPAAGKKGKFKRSIGGVANRYIVMLNNDQIDRFAVEPAVASHADYLQSLYGGKVIGVYAHAFKGYVTEMSEEAAIKLSSDSSVDLVEQDAEISVSDTQGGATWGIDRVDQRALPLNSTYTYSTTASNVNAYIIDTGIRPTHVEFGGRASADFDALGDGQNGIDCSGHGTHVAGTIGGATYGVAKGVRLHGVRVLPCSGSGLVSHLIMGVDWVTANRVLPAVANISITASGPSTAMDTAIQNSIDSGVTYAIAAGNSNMDACNYSPARIPAAITVGATYTADERASYSNWGTCVDIFAPGSSITSASHLNDLDSRVMSGTSMATPHVTGAAALYLAANPTASPATVAANMVNTATQGIVSNAGTGSPNRLLYTWFGSAPPAPLAGTVKIKKRITGRNGESTNSTLFPYDAVNFSTDSFALQAENEIVDPAVTSFGSANVIRVTEAQVLGWNLTSIACTETGTPGHSNVVNSVVDLVNRTASIVVEEGEQVECTFTSDEIGPTAADATITGQVVTPEGRGIRGTALTLLNAETGEVKYAISNTFGYYAFRDIEVGRFYVLTANGRKNARIDDNVRTFTLLDNLAKVDFVVRR